MSKSLLGGILLLILLVGASVLGVMYEQGAGFFGEQMPNADNVGEQIGMQYSRLRDLSVALDDLACRVEIVEQEQVSMENRLGSDELTWPADVRAEARNLRLERTTLLQRYSAIAAEYNELRSDIRTLPDDLGMQIDDIPQAENMSPANGMCGSFSFVAP